MKLTRRQVGFCGVRQVLVRIIRVNNRGKKAILAGETKAAAVWINEILFGHADAK